MLVKREFSAERMLAKKERTFSCAHRHTDNRKDGESSTDKTFAAFISAIASLHV